MVLQKDKHVVREKVKTFQKKIGIEIAEDNNRTEDQMNIS